MEDQALYRSNGSVQHLGQVRVTSTEDPDSKKDNGSYWNGIDERDRVSIMEITAQVRPLLAQENLYALQIGNLFRQAKAKIKRGCFSVWLKTEFGGVRTAQRLMKEAKLYDGNFEAVSILPRDFLHQLSQKAVTEEQRAGVVERCKNASEGDAAAIVADARASFLGRASSTGKSRKSLESARYNAEELRELAVALDAIKINDALHILNVIRRLGLRALAEQVTNKMERYPASIDSAFHTHERSNSHTTT